MDEADLKAIPQLAHLQILDEDHPAVLTLVGTRAADLIAEAADTGRLFDLLHRDEYQPIAAVRFRRQDSEGIRVYFRLLDQDD